jgi:DNA anti-recombination protein RmuC
LRGEAEMDAAEDNIDNGLSPWQEQEAAELERLHQRSERAAERLTRQLAQGLVGRIDSLGVALTNHVNACIDQSFKTLAAELDRLRETLNRQGERIIELTTVILDRAEHLDALTIRVAALERKARTSHWPGADSPAGNSPTAGN